MNDENIFLHVLLSLWSFSIFQIRLYCLVPVKKIRKCDADDHASLALEFDFWKQNQVQTHSVPDVSRVNREFGSQKQMLA